MHFPNRHKQPKQVRCEQYLDSLTLFLIHRQMSGFVTCRTKVCAKQQSINIMQLAQSHSLVRSVSIRACSLCNKCRTAIAVTAQSGAPSAMPPPDSHSFSCLRLYGSATRLSACAVPLVEAQRSGSLPWAIAMSLYRLCACARPRCTTGSAARSGSQPANSAAERTELVATRGSSTPYCSHPRLQYPTRHLHALVAQHLQH